MKRISAILAAMFIRSSASLLAILVLVAGLRAQPRDVPQYEIYAIRYATIPDFPVAGLVKGAERGRKMDLAMTIWLVKGNGRNILVDSGFYREQFFKDWKIKDFVKPCLRWD